MSSWRCLSAIRVSSSAFCLSADLPTIRSELIALKLARSELCYSNAVISAKYSLSLDRLLHLWLSLTVSKAVIFGRISYS